MSMKFASRDALREYILARASTAVGQEAIRESLIAARLVAAATFGKKS